jgi:hypothetical protein
MNAKKLYKNYIKNKDIFHNYINNIKQKNKHDLYSIINPTLIKNPYKSNFAKNYFLNNTKEASKNKIICFLTSTFIFYTKNIYLLFVYFISFILYKLYYKKQRENKITTIIDIFALVNKANKEQEFNENYLIGLYDILDKLNKPYTLHLRLYGVNKNPFKLINFFKIINKDKRDFIFEYELLSWFDFIRLFVLIAKYPFKTLSLLQKKTDKIFNYYLIQDIKMCDLNSFSRYIFGKNLTSSNTHTNISKIYSWCEFQDVERAFNYAIRKNSNIEIIGLQFWINYEIYFNAYVDDLDYDMLSSPHKVLVNGKYYILDRNKVKYNLGVSLRFKNIFTFECENIKKQKNILLLGSYIQNDTRYMLESIQVFDNIVFKSHPSIDINIFQPFAKNVTITNDNIYKLFKNTKIVISTASGTLLEAVACGISVIVVASKDNFTANPLIDYGKGKIYDIAFSENDIKKVYNKLIKYRKNNLYEIKKISLWYKNNFFIQPTKKNITKIFEL